MAKNKQNYNTNKIKRTETYSVNQISDLFHIHKRTAQAWFKEGLQRIDNQRPYLVLGSELKRFIKERQNKRKQKCQIDELYCMKCRLPRKVKGNQVLIIRLNEKSAQIVGICCDCGSKVNQLNSLKNIEKIAKIFMVKKIVHKDLIGCDDSLLNTDLKQV